MNNEASKSGIIMYAYNSASGVFWTGGTYAVTAPTSPAAAGSSSATGAGPSAD